MRYESNIIKYSLLYNLKIGVTEDGELYNLSTVDASSKDGVIKIRLSSICKVVNTNSLFLMCSLHSAPFKVVFVLDDNVEIINLSNTFKLLACITEFDVTGCSDEYCEDFYCSYYGMKKQSLNVIDNADRYTENLLFNSKGMKYHSYYDFVPQYRVTEAGQESFIAKTSDYFDSLFGEILHLYDESRIKDYEQIYIQLLTNASFPDCLKHNYNLEEFRKFCNYMTGLFPSLNFTRFYLMYKFGFRDKQFTKKFVDYCMRLLRYDNISCV